MSQADNHVQVSSIHTLSLVLTMYYVDVSVIVQFTMQNLQSRIQQCEMECQDKPNQKEFESCMNSKAGKVLDQFPNDTDELLAKLRAI